MSKADKTIKNIQFSKIEQIVNKETDYNNFLLERVDVGFNLICTNSICLEKETKTKKENATNSKRKKD